MANKLKARTIIDNLVVDGDFVRNGADVTPGTGVTLETQCSAVKRAKLKLTNFVVTVDADDDFGSTKLCDLPNSNLLILGAMVDLTAVGAGGFTLEQNLDLAIGTVATASADFSNAGEDNIVAKIDGTAGGVVDGSSISIGALVPIAAGASNDVFVNVATGDIATDGTVTLNGFIVIYYIDIDKAS